MLTGDWNNLWREEYRISRPKEYKYFILSAEGHSGQKFVLMSISIIGLTLYVLFIAVLWSMISPLKQV